MSDGNGFYMYVSTRACYDPAKTIFVFAPGEEAGELALAERFAVRSGWQALAEYDGAVLILPLARRDGRQSRSLYRDGFMNGFGAEWRAVTERACSGGAGRSGAGRR